MNTLLSWLAAAGAAVLLVAVAVAWLEHRRRAAARHIETAWSNTEVDVGAVAGTTVLDLSLDQPHGQGSQRADPCDEEREQADRQAVLAEALSRMARHRAEPADRNAWADTEPLGKAAPSELAESKTSTPLG